MRRINLLMLTVMLGAAVIGCSKAPPPQRPLTMEEVKARLCGKYIGRYAKGIEYFELTANDRFSQTFVQSGKTNYDVRSGGVWSFKKSDDRYYVYFTPFMSLQDTILYGKPPRQSTEQQCTYFEDENIIRIFEDVNYIMVKQDDVTVTNKAVR